jgi:Tol biopolymer transport system component
MNCHTFGSQDPTLSMMYVRGPGGGAILNQNGTLHKLNIPGSVYFGFSPSGRYLVFSTNKIIPAFHSIPRKRLEVFDSQSDILVADLQDHRIFSSTLLSDSTKFETFPTFSPDGHYIYYCAADSVNLPQDIQHLHYSLVRIPFDEQTGQIGTTVDTLVKCNTMASQSTGQSVCHPRISPDGRLLLYTVADYGTFPIWHPEADLQMLNLETGTIDSLQAVNSQKSDTYHSWSSNSRWFVFASKRDDGLFGKPYFCYVDKTGRAHKPFCLPQRHPTYYDNTLKSFNAPELGRGSVWFDTDDVAEAMKQAAETFTYQKY